eukprot:IDg15639t1
MEASSKKKSSKGSSVRHTPLKRKEPPSSTPNGIPPAPGSSFTKGSSSSSTTPSTSPSDFVPTKATPLHLLNPMSTDSYNILPIVRVPKCKKPRPAPPGARVHPTEEILGWDSQHSYIERWVRMTQEEQNGNVKFEVVKNDGKRESLLMLLGLKNVFVKQLPNMPRPYVSRLVFDRKHESLALMKKNQKGDFI